MKNETFFLLSQSLSGAAGPNPLMVLLPSSSNVGKDKDYSCQQEMGRGELNKTKPGFHHQRNGSVLTQCKPE